MDQKDLSVFVRPTTFLHPDIKMDKSTHHDHPVE
jgi:hypothetical protein